MNNKHIRKELLNKNLSRPNWTSQIHRDLSKLWLDKNESMDPKMNSIVMQALSKIPSEAVFSYPDLDSLYHKIAKYSEASPEEILVAAGSDGAIRSCFESFIVPGDNIILTRPTFAMYEVYAKVYGANVVSLDYEASPSGPILDLEKIIDEIYKIKPKMVCLPNPDSPTGTIFSPKDLKKIIIAAHEVGSLMLIDEAYHPIYSWSSIPWIREYNNLVIVRSFSKAWGAAGLRVGYVVANQKLIEFIHKQRPMYEIGNVSAKAIEVLLDYEKDMRLSVERVNSGKKHFQNAMKELGLISYESYGNFLHIKFGVYAEQIHKKLEGKVYYRKDFNELSLKGFSRFSATTVERFNPIIKSITTVIKKYNKNGIL